ncbi:hypothetical protein [Burkholderia cenocepacia]|uniref:hypothetical protein n=1 Tax=Burkholderia cenocepacia TaxID=95486 RepID=UPI0022385D47|nr:hypothetical protein [Burkholderia cenocepacia]MCW5156400.1 hypothetical protein [Burkholderia cenocepacia]
MTRKSKEKIDVEKINRTVSDLKKNHERITLMKVSKLTGIPYQSLYQSKLLDRYVNKIGKYSAEKDVVEDDAVKITVPHNLDAYTNHISKTYFQEPETMSSVLMNLHETVENFDHLMFRDVITYLRANKMIVRTHPEGDKWITTQGKKGEVSFFLPFDELDGERSLRLLFPSDLSGNEKQKVFHLLQSVMKMFE